MSQAISNLRAIPLTIHSNGVSKSGSIAFCGVSTQTWMGSISIFLNNQPRMRSVCATATWFPNLLHTINYYILKHRIQSSNNISNTLCVCMSWAISNLNTISLNIHSNGVWKNGSLPFTLRHHWNLFTILLVKIIKSHPCPKWSRSSSQPNKIKPKCTSGFIIHVEKEPGWWFVDLGFMFWFINAVFYGRVDWKVVKK